MAQQNNHVKTRVPTMKKRRNSTQFGDMLRNNSRHFGCSVDRRYCCDSSIKDYRNEHKCAFSCRKKSRCSKVNKVVNLEQMGKTGRNSRDINVSESNFGRVKRNVPKMKQESPKTVSSESIAWKCHKKMYMDCSQVANDSTEDENLECVKSREGKFAESCIAIKCSSLTTAEIDAGHDVEGGSISVMVHAAGNLNTSPSNPESHQSSEENSVRRRCMSDCSTDSDDSFVIFESGMDSDNHFSDDDDDFVDECDDIENETGLEEVNARWQRDYSEYSNYERNPVKVQFACDTSLETVHPMVKWNYAYRAARCGPWEQMARDRERFMRRIRQSEPLLAVVFSAEHRQRVWIKCMAETSPRHNS
ncbi:protein phosphatase 1 regulatory subunit 15A [Zootermopsis nevadensis]|uniref:protein phosphatase 1 regulatory subunit 15A n=1 Tax=Zootermopsis nevadensis TaxID=136037 RepID=UPI000B8ED8CB|nr:protein phosphatase 1 regulatory subunit 15A [Zootermopsis nevadensis]